MASGFRINVTLDKIVCRKTEDDLGSDEFYVIAALSKKSGKTQTALEGPWDINDGDVKEFAGGLTLFDEAADEGEYLVVITCWDQDASEDISAEDLKRASVLLDRVKDKVGEIRLNKGKSSEAANWVVMAIDGLFYLIRLLVNLDKDDFLGKDQQSLMVPNDWSPLDNSKAYPKRFKCTADGADYDVYYTIKLVDV
jgi:hypothetical protein